MNRKAFNRINYGLFLVGSVLEGKYQGCVVNSLHQITSSNPAKFSLSLNKSNETYKAVEAAGSFAATVLERGTPKELVDLFGYKSGRVVDKYEGFQVETDGAGNPYVKDHALARIRPGSAAKSWTSWTWAAMCCLCARPPRPRCWARVRP